MPMKIQCNNKGCCKTSEALLDKSDDKVYCIECGNEITNVTSFIKISLKTLGQFKREIHTNTAFMFTCPTCNKRSSPVINNGNVCCSICGDNLKDKISSVLYYNIQRTLKNK